MMIVVQRRKTLDEKDHNLLHENLFNKTLSTYIQLPSQQLMATQKTAIDKRYIFCNIVNYECEKAATKKLTVHAIPLKVIVPLLYIYQQCQTWFSLKDDVISADQCG